MNANLLDMRVDLRYSLEWYFSLGSFQVVDLFHGEHDEIVVVYLIMNLFGDPVLNDFQLLKNPASRILIARLLPSNCIQLSS